MNGEFQAKKGVNEKKKIYKKRGEMKTDLG